MANNYKFKGVALATTDETALLTAASTYNYCTMYNYKEYIIALLAGHFSD